MEALRRRNIPLMQIRLRLPSGPIPMLHLHLASTKGNKSPRPPTLPPTEVPARDSARTNPR